MLENTKRRYASTVILYRKNFNATVCKIQPILIPQSIGPIYSTNRDSTQPFRLFLCPYMTNHDLDDLQQAPAFRVTDRTLLQD